MWLRHERYHSSSHVPFLRYLRSKQASSHCDFQMSLSALNGLFVLKESHFFLPSALLSLCNLLSVSFSFSQHAENRLGLKGLFFNWKHLWSRELCWWGAVETGYYGISTSLASDWWRRETLARVQGWSGYRTTSSLVSLPSAVWGQWHSYCWKKGSDCVNNTRDGLASELTVCLRLSDQWDMVFWISPQRHTNTILNHYLCSINNTKHSLNPDALIILWDLGLVHTNVWSWIESISVLDFF